MPTQKQKKLSNYFDNDRATLHTVYTYYIYIRNNNTSSVATYVSKEPPARRRRWADTIYRHSKKVKPTQ